MIHHPLKSTVDNNSRRFSKLFGKCLPSRKGKTIEDPPVTDTQEKSEGDSKKVDSSPKISEKESVETKPTNEDPDPSAPEEPVTEEENETAEEAAMEGSTEVNEGEEVQTVDPQEEDSMWEVSCCGVDMPLSK